MSTQIILSLPDETYRRAERLAGLIGRDITDVLAETLDISLPLVDETAADSASLPEMTDAEVTELSNSQMELSDSRRFQYLLHAQQEGSASNQERSQLLVLMQSYQTGLLRKAQALHEAVVRGLIDPLKP